MNFLRNPEIKRFGIIYIGLTAVAFMGALYFGVLSGIYLLVVCGAALALFFIFTKRRYDEIADLSAALDHILHGEQRTDFVPDKEGELALLSSEIYKMTVRLQEQTELLQKEKLYLSSSIEDISHQLKTPLTSMRMLIPRLTRENLTTQQKQEGAQEVLRLLARMEWLITALLKVAKLESETAVLEKVKVSVGNLVERAWEPLEILAEIKGIGLETDIGSEISYIGDMGWSVEAVGNILKNCVEHMKQGGVLKVQAAENPLYAELVIEDNGTGISKDDLPHLFERFYKGKDASTEHVGIGLNLSHMIVRRQNGTIKVENVQPHGARFIIRFYKGAI